MAHAVLQHLTASLPTPPRIDSAGTGAYHAHSPPDPRTMKTLRAHGVHNFEHAARKVRPSDFSDFDYVLAMDDENLEDLRDAQERVRRKKGAAEEGAGKEAKVVLFGEYGGRGLEVVSDPYYGGGQGFETAYEQCVRFSKGWVKEVLGVEVGGK